MTGAKYNMAGRQSRVGIAEKGIYEYEDEGVFVAALGLLTP